MTYIEDNRFSLLFLNNLGEGTRTSCIVRSTKPGQRAKGSIQPIGARQGARRQLYEAQQ